MLTKTSDDMWRLYAQRVFEPKLFQIECVISRNIKAFRWLRRSVIRGIRPNSFMYSMQRNRYRIFHQFGQLLRFLVIGRAKYNARGITVRDYTIIN